jgi:phosphoribosylformylglycinamidine (FGAM) synthase-like enzyme
MNERIKELAMTVQCNHHWSEADIEKFAELIVRECINKLYANGLWCLETSEVLKEHFGLEQ